jgi:hypothetical protein
MMKNFVHVLLGLSLTVFAIANAAPGSKSSPAAAEKKPSGQKADAKTLLHDAKKATAAMIKNARADKDLDPKKPKNKPFWKSVHLVTKNLNTAESGFAAKNNDFFIAIPHAREAEEQMKVDWQLTDSKNKKVIEDGKKLGHSLTMLRTNFSKEAERKKSGGQLTDKEKAQFEKIKAQQKDLIAKIKKLEGEAKKDKALEKGLAEIEKQAAHISKEPGTLDAFIATLYLLDAQAGLIRGYEYYVDKDWRKDYLILVDYTKTYEIWYSEWQGSVKYDWANLNTTVDIHEGEDVDVSDVSDEEVGNEASYAENESFDMSEAEEDEVAAEEDNDEEVAPAGDDSMEEASDDAGEDVSDDDGGD